MKLKYLVIVLFLISIQFSFSQKSERISTVDFIQIVDNNREETLFYYEYNWKALRAIALKKNYIASFEIMETPYSAEAPFHLMLITTYANKVQYEQREKHFQELIKAKGKLLLLNDKIPSEFRINLFHKENVMHQSKEILVRKN
ncbi:hypothetical protein H2O64_13765 [Kordia sp. YSTF-M3]|uniref:Uncharacterized protein n=1 Tax=Kordia aestuariivivens TaxID=2759037 RepID=A0ABR7QBG5_9FLAO|nr:hypothetical protein [Kordia aestuariivivens]